MRKCTDLKLSSVQIPTILQAVLYTIHGIQEGSASVR
ncbi:unnamed protein product [Lathyrus oleraceus]